MAPTTSTTLMVGSKHTHSKMQQQENQAKPFTTKPSNVMMKGPKKEDQQSTIFCLADEVWQFIIIAMILLLHRQYPHISTLSPCHLPAVCGAV